MTHRYFTTRICFEKRKKKKKEKFNYLTVTYIYIYTYIYICMYIYDAYKRHLGEVIMKLCHKENLIQPVQIPGYDKIKGISRTPHVLHSDTFRTLC